MSAVAGALIRLPRSKRHCPDRDRLAIRFEQFERLRRWAHRGTLEFAPVEIHPA
jgi:hypothetical protein